MPPQCMATRATRRGRGAASAVVAAIASEAIQVGVDRMYLAVLADNAPALSLYGRVGFQAVHRYQYWRIRASSQGIDETVGV